MHVRFLKDGFYKPHVNQTVDFKKDDTKNVPTPIAEKLIAEGKAEAATDIVGKNDSEAASRPGTGAARAKAKEAGS